VGSTYNFNDISVGITEAGRRELEQKLREIMTIPYEVIGQEWGLRPTTPDRRPLLGNHPESDRLIIFNGLGTKGVSLAPYFSEVLLRWLENSGSLNKDVALTRYK
jgi:glycine oxidase